MNGFLVAAAALSTESRGATTPRVFVTLQEDCGWHPLQVSFIFNYKNIITHSHKITKKQKRTEYRRLNNWASLLIEPDISHSSPLHVCISSLLTQNRHHWEHVVIHHRQQSLAQHSRSASCSRAAGNLFSTTSLQAELFLALPSVGGGWHDGFLSICTLL